MLSRGRGTRNEKRGLGEEFLKDILGGKRKRKIATIINNHH